MGRVWGPGSYDEEEVMDSRPRDQDVDVDVDQPRMALGFGEVGDVWIVRTAEAGRQAVRQTDRQAGRQGVYARGRSEKCIE